LVPLPRGKLEALSPQNLELIVHPDVDSHEKWCSPKDLALLREKVTA